MKNYGKSRELLEQSGQYLAGGVSSSLRSAMKPTPLFAHSAAGARVRDVDGNEYIDYLMAYGPSLLGHAHQALVKRVTEAMGKGITYGLQHEGEIEMARKLTELLPCADKIAFSGSGTEAVMLALRLARAYTGKKKIVRFHGHYHGWSDSIFTSYPSPDMRAAEEAGAGNRILPGTGGQSEASLEEVILLPWNDEAAIERLLEDSHTEIAAVITEPVMCNSGCILPKPGYLEKLRELTSRRGIVLIFDEVITGFRLSIEGAHGRFGIRPDLMTMGKALGGGLSLSAVGGCEAIMKLIEDGTVSHLGTLNGNTVSLAAGLATLEALEANGGELLPRMEQLAIRLAEGLRELLAKHAVRGVVNGIGPVFHFMFIDRDEVTTFEAFGERDSSLYASFAERMLDEGVLLRPSGLWYVSGAHVDADIDATLQAADRALSSLSRR